MRKFILAAAAVLSLGLGLRAEVDPKNFDLAVKPQDDFYHYANGAWLKNNPVPGEFSRWGGFIVLQEENHKNLRTICERVAANGTAGTATEKMVGFAEQCMAEYDIDGWKVPDMADPGELSYHVMRAKNR